MRIEDKLLVAEGDSWFSHPFIRNIVKTLEHPTFGYDVKSVAHWSHTIEHMATNPRERRGLDLKFKLLAKQKRVPRAVLLSGGGNDIIGILRHLVNKKEKGVPILNEGMLVSFLDNCVLDHYRLLVDFVNKKCEKRFGVKPPILIHGYDYLVPDGRDYCNTTDDGWIEPELFDKGHKNLRRNTKAVEKMINVFNKKLSEFIMNGRYSNLRYVDLRCSESNKITNDEYMKLWKDEIHPSSRAFRRMAAKYDEAIKSLVSVR